MTEPYSVPIVPGTPHPDPPVPMTVVAPPPVEPQRRRRRWLIPLLAALGVLAVAGGILTFLVLRNPAQFQAATGSGDRPLTAAWRACGGKGELSDGDRTLFLDMRGKEDSAGLSATDISCVLDQLKAPEFVVREMEQTRAIDGRQSDHWASFEASWTYHPDQGLDVLIREK